MRIAITGGKGGTGKSVIAINLAIVLHKMGKKVLLVDADVDSPADFFLLGTEHKNEKEVKSFIPIINEDKCTKCGLCVKECPENAMFQPPGKFPKIFQKMCIGCKKCQLVCPFKAIDDGERTIGKIVFGHKWIDVVGGELIPTEPFSAKIVDAVLDEMKEMESNYDIIIIDTSAGTHCNVIHALYESDIAVAVTEPTPFGIKDSKEILDILKKMGIESHLLLNKAGISDIKIKEKVIESIPYDKKFIECYMKGSPFVLEYPNSIITKKIESVAMELIR